MTLAPGSGWRLVMALEFTLLLIRLIAWQRKPLVPKSNAMAYLLIGSANHYKP
jgi:hypothetical protein